MFASRSVTVHAVRGFLGAAAFVLAFVLVPLGPLVAIPLTVAGFVALRGCPMCWTVGLVQTILLRQGNRAAGAACPGGRCAARRGNPMKEKA